jgi:hypothetical protein
MGIEAEEEIQTPSLTEEPAIYSRSGRRRKIPKAYRDFVPSSLAGLTSDVRRLAPLPSIHVATTPNTPTPIFSSSEVPIANLASPSPTPPLYITEPNEFGVFRCYATKPTQDAEDEVGSAELCDSPDIATVSSNPAVHPLQGFGKHTVLPVDEAPDTPNRPWYSPFLNSSIYRIMHWAYTGS